MIRWFVIAISVCVLGVVWYFSRPYISQRAEIAAIAKLKAAGAKIQNEQTGATVSLRGVLDRQVVRQVRHIRNLKHLDVSGTNVDGSDLAAFGTAADLESFNATRNNKIRDIGHIARFAPNLKSLDLAFAVLDQSSLTSLSELKQLRLLDLAYTGIPDRCASYLDNQQLFWLSVQGNGLSSKFFWELSRRCPNLTDLYASGCQIDLNAWEALSKFANLQRLDVSMTELGNIESFEFPSLRSLRLVHCKNINDADVSVLSKIKTLISVQLDGCNISDQCIPDLEQLPNLSELSTTETRIRPESVMSSTLGKQLLTFRH